jgi:hypothetical protein
MDKKAVKVESMESDGSCCENNHCYLIRRCFSVSFTINSQKKGGEDENFYCGVMILLRVKYILSPALRTTEMNFFLSFFRCYLARR